MTPGSARRVVPLDPDRSLVRAAQADPSRFDALYRKYLAQVYSFAHHELGDHHEAEDVTERTFMLALGALPRFRDAAPDDAGPEASTFRVWLFRIARNVIANHRRAARRRPTAPLEAAAGVAAPEDVEGRAVARADASAAWAAVRRLPGDRRRAVVLRFVDEMSTAEIAGILERSEGAVRVLLHRALRSVARELSGTGAGDGQGARIGGGASRARDSDGQGARIGGDGQGARIGGASRAGDVRSGSSGPDRGSR